MYGFASYFRINAIANVYHSVYQGITDACAWSCRGRITNTNRLYRYKENNYEIDFYCYTLDINIWIFIEDKCVVLQKTIHNAKPYCVILVEPKKIIIDCFSISHTSVYMERQE